ncbi:DUF7019 family protein [Leptospira interrogans]
MRRRRRSFQGILDCGGEPIRSSDHGTSLYCALRTRFRRGTGPKRCQERTFDLASSQMTGPQYHFEFLAETLIAQDYKPVRPREDAIERVLLATPIYVAFAR